MQINLLSNLSLDNDGRLVNQSLDYVHLRQGEMDGACGPYCVAMSLLARNMEKRTAFLALTPIDFRTRAGRLLKEIHKADPMVLGGMDVTQMQELFAAHNTATSKLTYGTSRQLLDVASQSINNDFPVILNLHGRKAERLDHWTLAIGTDSENIYLLDPGYDLPVGSYWNAMITVAPKTTRFGYRYINPWCCQDVEVETILEVQ